MKELLTSFDGRIGRGQFWLGVLVLVVAAIVIAIIVGIVLGDNLFGRIVMLLVSLALLYPAIALTVKRLADRGKPPMPRVAIFFLPGLLLNVFNTFQIGYQPMPQGIGGPGMMPGNFVLALGLVSMIVSLWAIIELGLLKGDAGANRYGPAPG